MLKIYCLVALVQALPVLINTGRPENEVNCLALLNVSSIMFKTVDSEIPPNQCRLKNMALCITDNVFYCRRIVC